MNTLKLGLIGAGRIGKLHAENLVRIPGVEIKTVSEIYADDVLRAWASRLGIKNVTTDYKELLADPEIGAVFICSSTDTHVPIIREAAAAGKHIFCEKPISFRFEHTKEALTAAEQAGVLLQVGFNRRFDHNFSRVRAMVAEGKIGAPHLVKITSRDPSPPPKEYVKVSGGLFIDMAIHDFDMARFLSGSEVEEVFAQGAVLIDPEIGELGDIDTALITLRFANGALGVIDNSRKAVYGYDQRVEVFGSQGCVTVSNDFPNSAVLATENGLYQDKQKLFFLERYNDSYIDETKQFIDAIQNGKPVPVSGRDALQAELIAHAAKRSLELGRPVKLEEMV